MRGTDDARGVYNWLRRVTQAYYTLDADKVPRAFLESYEDSCPVAAHNGTVVSYDYSDRQRIVSGHRPDTDLPEINALRQKVEAHATLRIRCDPDIEDWKLPAYRTKLEQESDRELDQLTQISEQPPAEIEPVAHDEAGRINELARIHMENGVRHPEELGAWQKPRYDQYLRNHGGQNFAIVEELPEHIPSSPGEIADYETAAEVMSKEPVAESSQTVPEKQSQIEKAELFLVFSEGDDEERGAKVLDMARSQLCGSLDFPHTAGDDVVWEEVRHLIENIIK
jgi:hypothetical protein